MSNLIILYDYHEAPPFLVTNPHIKTGYRAFLPTKLCLKSLFTLHNETVNIWSHLLVGLYFFYQYFYDFSLLVERGSTSSSDRIAFLCMIITIQICMFSSTAFHLFNCHSQNTCSRLLLVDCIGIGIGLSGCFFPVTHCAFYCFPQIKMNYIIFFLLGFLVAGYLITRPWFGDKRYVYLRIITYCFLSMMGFAPAAHWTYIHGLESEIVSIFLPKIVLLYFLGAAGLFFYVTQVPESLLPGRFDIFGHSHQIWHIFAALVFIIGHQTQQNLFLYVTSNPCPS